MYNGAFTYISDIKYKVNDYGIKDHFDQSVFKAVVKSTGDSFKTSFPELIFTRYLLPHITDEETTRGWFYCNAINFFCNEKLNLQ